MTSSETMATDEVPGESNGPHDAGADGDPGPETDGGSKADGEPGPEAGGRDAGDDAGGAGGQGAWQPDPRVPRLQAELAAKDKQLREFIDAYKTARQEMDAARGRLERDKERELERMRAKVVEQLIDVLDNLDRSVAGVRPGARIEDIQVGLQMVREQFYGALAGFGLEKIEALGADFDTALHEATGMIPAGPTQRDQEVVFVERSGYTFAGKLLRPARVLIAHKG